MSKQEMINELKKSGLKTEINEKGQIIIKGNNSGNGGKYGK